MKKVIKKIRTKKNVENYNIIIESFMKLESRKQQKWNIFNWCVLYVFWRVSSRENNFLLKWSHYLRNENIKYSWFSLSKWWIYSSNSNALKSWLKANSGGCHASQKYFADICDKNNFGNKMLSSLLAFRIETDKFPTYKNNSWNRTENIKSKIRSNLFEVSFHFHLQILVFRYLKILTVKRKWIWCISAFAHFQWQHLAKRCHFVPSVHFINILSYKFKCTRGRIELNHTQVYEQA